MTTTLATGPVERYLADFQALERQSHVPEWLRDLRRKGIGFFEAHGFPTARRGNEPWKYTNVAPIAETAFALAAPSSSLSSKAIAAHVLARDWLRLTFVDGRYSPGLSSVRNLPSGVRLGTMADAIDDPVVSRHLARLVTPEADAFASLNAAFVTDGAFLHLSPGMVLERPLQLLFIGTGPGAPVVAHPRILLLAGRGSMATVVESYASLGEGTYFTNVAAEVYLGEGAALEHYKLLFESQQAYHVANTHVHQAHDSRFTATSISAGAALARNTLTVVLDGEGAQCSLNGLHFTTGTQHLDNTLFIDHAKPHTTSNEFYKGILDGNSRAVFGGRVLVRRDAQKVEAHQYDRNLVLSQGAEVDSKPQLEIYADDVKCTHGATASQLSAGDLFYLQSRGIDKNQARDLLARGFAVEILDRVGPLPIRRQAEALLLHGLPSVDG